jgi:SSS family solute:Na+ symporter
VLQFFLIWFGALLIPILGLIEAGGWKGLVARIQHNFPDQNFTHAWSTLGKFQDNPMGMHWTGIVFGLGAVISMGYWTTDFLVVQRVLSARDLRSAKLAPIIGSFFKMAVPLIVILPGLIGLAVLPEKLVPESALQPGQHSYNDVLPLMLARYCGPGLMGLGVTALVAGFMAGMAGNVSAFATVWTYDISRPFIRKTATDQHYVSMGRWCTIIGLFISIGTAYLAMGFASIMDYVQALFSFFIAPLFGTVLIGMLWKRATPLGGFLGLLAGTLTAIGIFVSMKIDRDLVAVFALSPLAKGLAQDMYQALWSCLVCVLVTVVVSLATTPKPVAELTGLVYGFTPIPKEENVSLLHKPIFWACVAVALFVILQIVFW